MVAGGPLGGRQVSKGSAAAGPAVMSLEQVLEARRKKSHMERVRRVEPLLNLVGRGHHGAVPETKMGSGSAAELDRAHGRLDKKIPGKIPVPGPVGKSSSSTKKPSTRPKKIPDPKQRIRTLYQPPNKEMAKMMRQALASKDLHGPIRIPPPGAHGAGAHGAGSLSAGPSSSSGATSKHQSKSTTLASAGASAIMMGGGSGSSSGIMGGPSKVLTYPAGGPIRTLAQIHKGADHFYAHYASVEHDPQLGWSRAAGVPGGGRNQLSTSMVMGTPGGAEGSAVFADSST